MKRCPACARYLPLDAFHRARDRSDGRRSLCKQCITAMQRRREQRLGPFSRRKLGITPADVARLLHLQSHRCAICSAPLTERKTADGEVACVDHDHDTGRIRGLLCHGCNTGLGNFGDDPDLTQAATDYLRRHAASPIDPYDRNGRLFHPDAGDLTG